MNPVSVIPETVDFGGDGPPLHLAHGNGYPPGAYAPLAAALAAHFHVTSMVTRPLWPGSTPGGLRSWQPLADDLLAYLEARGARGWVGVGHSLGTLLTADVALRRPEFFRALVLIDPVLLAPVQLAVWNLIRRLGLARWVHPLILTTLGRQRVFASTEAMYARYRRAPVFRRVSDAGLRAYVDAAAHPAGAAAAAESSDGARAADPAEGPPVELAYSPEWEAAVYAHGPLNLWPRFARLQPPLLVIRGAESDTFRPAAEAALRRRLPRAVFHTVPATGHLVPLEAPGVVADLILRFLDRPRE